jgi:hypothetical protein
MTTNERNELIGRPATRREGAYTVNVTVKDVKEAFGRTDLLRCLSVAPARSG